jgi:hypothetical protein
MKKNYHVEEERGMFHIITITTNAAADALSSIGGLILILASMRPGDKPGSYLVQVEQRKRLA